MAANPIPKEEMLHTIAHEIGHIIVGLGHPDQGGGPAPLPGTDHLKRLMYSELNPKIQAGHLNTNLLVKGEWDEAEQWLEARSNNQN